MVFNNPIPSFFQYTSWMLLHSQSQIQVYFLNLYCILVSVWYALDMKPSCLLYYLNRFFSFYLTSPSNGNHRPLRQKPIDHYQPPNHWQLVSSLVKSFSFAELPWENQDQICPLESHAAWWVRWVQDEVLSHKIWVWALMIIHRTVFLVIRITSLTSFGNPKQPTKWNAASVSKTARKRR